MQQTKTNNAAKIGAILYILWGVLHLWVGFEGVGQYFNGLVGQWNMIIGGSKVPLAAFQHNTDSTTAYAQAHLILNFCIDVAGYGVLAMFVAYLIWTKASWTGYWIGLIVIGIGDLAFLFCMVTSGVIVLNAGTVGGPVLWLLAVIITPFGLPKNR